MKVPRFPSLILCLLWCSVSGLAASLTVGSDDWKPVDPADLALKGSVVEKDADAEALFWEVRVDDNPEGDLIFTHYIRIKVFTDRGRESQSKIDIPFGNLFGEIKIKDIAARTLKPDGSIVELKKDDVYERTIVKASGAKLKAKSFAMPAVEAGCIIEYRWREVRVGRSANYVRLQFQRDIPVQRVTYLIKPFPFEGLSFRSITFHGNQAAFAKEKNGFYSTTMTNMPAVHEESRMPPEDQIKTWMLVYYSRDEKIEPEKYWSDIGKRVYENTKSLLKANNDVRQMAASLTADAKSDDDKVQRLFEFCRTKIKNISDDASGLTADDRKKIKENKSPADTLKQGKGTGEDVDLLFAALATASGFDSRIVLAPNRGDIFFNKELPNSYFVDPANIAVNMSGTWKFFNPGYNYVPLGMLRWQEEGEEALITDPKQPIWVQTPLSPPEKSQTKRRANLTLSEDGTLEGDVRLEFYGQFAIERKEENDDDSESQREESLKEEVKSRLSTAELTGIKIENVTDPVKPFIYSYHLRVPGYAQRTGKRLFLQPAFFQHGNSPLFAQADRKYPIYFHYPWSENDEVAINLPPGYTLENAEAPASFGSGNISDYKPSLAVSTDGKFLVYKRTFFFGGNGLLIYPVTSYGQLRGYFDMLYKQDNHTVSLKQTAASQ
jgi:Domain of Unknown Function with PDB structure (DUF3857)/Transglutaminase-like superfamily